MNWLPKHKCGLYLTHNENIDFYESVEEYISIGELEESFISQEEIKKSIDENSIWKLRWYPDTQTSFYEICAASLDAIEHAIKARSRND